MSEFLENSQTREGEEIRRFTFAFPREKVDYWYKLSITGRDELRLKSQQPVSPSRIEEAVPRDLKSYIDAAGEDAEQVTIGLSQKELDYLLGLQDKELDKTWDAQGRAMAKGLRWGLEEAYRNAKEKSPRPPSPSLGQSILRGLRKFSR